MRVSESVELSLPRQVRCAKEGHEKEMKERKKEKRLGRGKGREKVTKSRSTQKNTGKTDWKWASSLARTNLALLLLPRREKKSPPDGMKETVTNQPDLLLRNRLFSYMDFSLPQLDICPISSRSVPP